MVGGSLRVLRLLPPLKLVAMIPPGSFVMIIAGILIKMIDNNNKQHEPFF
jgi:hypothetical protein